jgi:hypothetical protein
MLAIMAGVTLGRLQLFDPLDLHAYEANPEKHFAPNTGQPVQLLGGCVKQRRQQGKRGHHEGR